MQLVTEDNITDLAVERWATAGDPRLAEVDEARLPLGYSIPMDGPAT